MAAHVGTGGAHHLFCGLSELVRHSEPADVFHTVAEDALAASFLEIADVFVAIRGTDGALAIRPNASDGHAVTALPCEIVPVYL